MTTERKIEIAKKVMNYHDFGSKRPLSGVIGIDYIVWHLMVYSVISKQESDLFSSELTNFAIANKLEHLDSDVWDIKQKDTELLRRKKFLEAFIIINELSK